MVLPEVGFTAPFPVFLLIMDALPVRVGFALDDPRVVYDPVFGFCGLGLPPEFPVKRREVWFRSSRRQQAGGYRQSGCVHRLLSQPAWDVAILLDRGNELLVTEAVLHL